MIVHVDIWHNSANDETITCEEFESVEDAREFLAAVDAPSFEETWGLNPEGRD